MHDPSDEQESMERYGRVNVQKLRKEREFLMRHTKSRASSIGLIIMLCRKWNINPKDVDEVLYGSGEEYPT